MPIFDQVHIATSSVKPVKVMCLAFLLLACQNLVHAADGAFDTSFGTSGRKTFALSANGPDFAYAVVETPDGKLLLAGSCSNIGCLARMLPDGSFDTSYGPLQLGYVSLNQFAGVPNPSGILDLVLLPDGRAAAIGCEVSTTYFADIYILLANGTGLDTTVGGGSGFIKSTPTSITGSQCPRRILQQPDGKFLVLQSGTIPNYGTLMTVSRFAADLSGADPSFGTNGAVQIAFGLAGPTGNLDAAASMKLQSDGKIVIAGYGSVSSRAVAEFARLTTSGQLDASFGGNGDGRVHLDENPASFTVNDIAFDASQRIVFGGRYLNGSSYYQMVGRLTKDGVLDTSFKNVGYSIFQSPQSTDPEKVMRLAVSADSIVALAQVGRETNNGTYYFEVTRVDNNGNLVPTFGAGGSSYASFGTTSSSDSPAALLMTRRGIVVAGHATVNNTEDLAIARLLYEHIFANSFE